MACCGQKRRPDTTQLNPLIFGVWDHEELAVRARLNHAIRGYRRRDIVWVAGDTLAEAVDARHLTLI